MESDRKRKNYRNFEWILVRFELRTLSRQIPQADLIQLFWIEIKKKKNVQTQPIWLALIVWTILVRINFFWIMKVFHVPALFFYLSRTKHPFFLISPLRWSKNNPFCTIWFWNFYLKFFFLYLLYSFHWLILGFENWKFSIFFLAI